MTEKTPEMESRKEPNLTVLVLEDDGPTLLRFCDAIDADVTLEVCGQCETLGAALSLYKTTKPDVIVTDLKLPDGSGLDLIKTAREDRDDVEIMVISALGDERTVVAAIEAGATGYLLKDADLDDIARSIHQLVDGGSPISASIARFILKRFDNRAVQDEPGPDKPTLTDREVEVLSCIAKGFSYKDVARVLNLSENTVPSHIKNIYRKLEVNSKSEAVFEAVQRGILNLE